MLVSSGKPMKIVLLSFSTLSNQPPNCRKSPMSSGPKSKYSLFTMATVAINALSIWRSTFTTRLSCSQTSLWTLTKPLWRVVNYVMTITSTKCSTSTRPLKKCKIANLAVALTLLWLWTTTFTSLMSVIVELLAQRTTELSLLISLKTTSLVNFQSSSV